MKTENKKDKKKTTQSPLMIGNETFGQRLCRLRKKQGLTQNELRDRTDLIQVLISDYENDRLRPYHEIIIRLSKGLKISSDELLGLENTDTEPAVDMKIMKRMKKIQKLPSQKQKLILQSIDLMLKGAESDK